MSKEITERPNHSLALKGWSAKQGRCCSRPTTHLKGNDVVGHSNNVVGWAGHSTYEVVVNHLLTLKGVVGHSHESGW